MRQKKEEEEGGAWPDLSRGSSQRGSWGSSYSDTPDNMGEPLEESREGRTSITPEWMEELESTETWRRRRLTLLPSQ